MATLATLVVRVTSDVSGLVGGMAKANAATESLSSRMNTAGRTAMSAGRTMTRGVTLPVVAAGAAAVNLAVDFEESMSHIDALVGASDKQMSMYEKHVLDMARTMPQTPLELADALYFVTSSGFEGAEALDVLRASARASAAGLGETKVVADAVTSAVNAYGKANLSASKATDILLGAVREGKGEPEELAHIIGRLMPLAQELGVEFDEVASSLAGLTLTGLDAAEAGTAVRGVMNTFAKPSAGAVKLLKEMGYTIEGLERGLREDFFGTLVDLRQNLTKADIQPSKIFPNVRALTGFLSLTGKNAKKNARIFEELARAGGDTDKAYKAASKTFKFQWRQTLASIQVTAIELGNIMLPMLREFVEWLGRLARSFGDLSPEMQRWIVIGLAIAAVIGPVVFILGALATALGAVLSPVGLVIAAIVAFGVAMITLYNKSETFRDLIQSVWAAVSAFIKSHVELIKAIWDRFGDDFIRVAERIASIVGPAFRGFLTMITGAIRAITRLIKGDFKGAWDIWKEYATAALFLFAESGVRAFAALLRFGTTAAFKLASAWISVMERIVELGTHLPGPFGEAFKLVSGQFDEFADKARTGMRSVRNAINHNVDEWEKNTIDGMNRTRRAIENEMAAATPPINEFGGTVDLQAAKVGRAATDIQNHAARIAHSLDDAPSRWAAIGEAMISGLTIGIRNKTQEAVEAARGMAQEVEGAVRKQIIVASPSKLFAQLGNYIGEGLALGMRQRYALVGATAERMVPIPENKPRASQSGMDGGFGGGRGRLYLDLENGTAVVDFMEGVTDRTDDERTSFQRMRDQRVRKKRGVAG